jgi:outer membrane protein OmpA-like peptidoglycan-associated protein
MRLARAWGVFVCGMLAAPAAGQAPGALHLRGEAAVGLLISDDQHAVLGFDRPAFEGRLRGGVAIHRIVALELGTAVGAYLSSDDALGGLLDLTGGAAVTLPVGPRRFWIAAHAGVAVTGDLVRPALRLAFGLDFLVAPDLFIGPSLAYGHVFQENGPTFTDDAQILTLAFSVRFAPGHDASTPRPEARTAPDPTAVRERRAPLQRDRLRSHLPPPEEVERAPASEDAILGLLDQALELPRQELLVPVLFAFDSTELVPCSVAALHALRRYLEEHPEILTLEVEGHADGQGDEAYNDALSLRRAEAIVAWLVEHGVAAERLEARARGEAAPLEGNEDEPGRQVNRRVRFTVVEVDDGPLQPEPEPEPES